MRRGYERERPNLSVEQQDASMRRTGVPVEGTHPPIYRDLIKDTRSHKPLAQRAHAINSLRLQDSDELVIHDAATMGRNHEEICEGLAAVGRSGCKLIICEPTYREFVWTPNEAEMLAVAAEGVTLLRSARGKASGNKTGAAPKLVGNVKIAADAAWGDPKLTARQAVEKIFETTGVRVSTRLLFAKLGLKSAAELQVLRPALPAPSKPKRKTKPKRRKVKRKVKAT
jgi:hypothetical protein